MFSAPDTSHDPLPAPSPRRFRRVLVAWDASADATAALRAAAAIVGDESGHVVALAILPAPFHLEQERDQGGAGPEAERAERIFELVRESVAATSRARLSLQIAEGRKVAPSICDYAAEQGFDLLVLGRHSDSSLLHHRLGHVAEAAARSSRIPVLLLGAQ